MRDKQLTPTGSNTTGHGVMLQPREELTASRGLLHTWARLCCQHWLLRDIQLGKQSGPSCPVPVSQLSTVPAAPLREGANFVFVSEKPSEQRNRAVEQHWSRHEHRVSDLRDWLPLDEWDLGAPVVEGSGDEDLLASISPTYDSRTSLLGWLH